MKEKNIPDLNVFMMCEKLNIKALKNVPKEFHVRNCRRDEIDIWKNFPFDTNEEKEEYKNFMTEYFNKVYKKFEDLFYDTCLFLCDENDRPIATCFVWKSYNKVYTLHWLKVLKEYEGKGLGRVMLSSAMRNIPQDNYPIYLHTQPSSFRAIKLYSDFGFTILTDPKIGNRENDYIKCLPILKKFMGEENFLKLIFKESDKTFSEIASQTDDDQF